MIGPLIKILIENKVVVSPLSEVKYHLLRVNKEINTKLNFEFSSANFVLFLLVF